MNKAFLNWSSGKDAAFALYLLRQESDILVDKLVTSVNSELERISMHGLREELLVRQAEAIGLPLHCISLPGNLSMETYNSVMRNESEKLKAEGYTHSIFGDIFLEDLRSYREKQLAEVGLEAIFPLWKKNTLDLFREFLSLGFKAITVCVNAAVLDRSFCGRILDERFLNELPEGVDPCGENGEFHTFVFDGPGFRKPVGFRKGEIVERGYASSGDEDQDCFSDEEQSWDTRFWYCDLLPA